MRREERIKAFVEEIWSWYLRHKRSLPWRDMDIKNDTERAYRVLVSEIMLQQTQVSRVIIIFRNFLERFPTLADLAKASNKDVIIAWKGMGYNSRALRLRDAAQTIVTRYSYTRYSDGKSMIKIVFPSEMDDLLAIKGIGPYTASAIRNFAFNIATPGIDTNIRRVLHRVFIGPENSDGTFAMSDKKLLPLCNNILDAWIAAGHSPRDFFAALMDFGSLVQTKSNPKWEICPLTQNNLMKAKSSHYTSRVTSNKSQVTRREPGRFVGAKYIPNRIFRGRIVDALREHSQGLTADTIGKEICIDWSKEHKDWLKKLITKLIQDRLVAEKGKKYVLAE